MDDLRGVLFLLVAAFVVQIYCKPAQISELETSDSNQGLVEKRRWDGLRSWGKKWNEFASWGKRSGVSPSRKRWSEFTSWGKRNRDADKHLEEKRKWGNFAVWGKRGSSWSGLHSWGKRSSEVDEALTQKIMDILDKNGDNQVSKDELVGILPALFGSEDQGATTHVRQDSV